VEVALVRLQLRRGHFLDGDRVVAASVMTALPCRRRGSPRKARQYLQRRLCYLDGWSVSGAK